MNKTKIMFVDDDVNILSSFRRRLFEDYNIITCSNVGDALENLEEEHNEIGVIVSDLRMPVVDGAKFLSIVKEEYPDIVRILLTGNSGIYLAIKAVNEGNVFRFLQKPMDFDELTKVLDQALSHHELLNTERHLLEETFNASINVMIEMLSLSCPLATSRSSKIRDICCDISNELKLDNQWVIETSAMLSQIGMVTLPDDILQKINMGESLNTREMQMYRNHPNVAYDLIRRIPRLEPVANIIKHQQDDFKTHQLEIGDHQAFEMCVSAILRVAIDYEQIRSRGLEHKDIIDEMKMNKYAYHTTIFSILENHSSYMPFVRKVDLVPISLLKEGSVLAEDVKTIDGTLIARKGGIVTFSLKQMLMNQLIKHRVSSEVQILHDEKEATY